MWKKIKDKQQLCAIPSTGVFLSVSIPNEALLGRVYADAERRKSRFDYQTC